MTKALSSLFPASAQRISELHMGSHPSIFVHRLFKLSTTASCSIRTGKFMKMPRSPEDLSTCLYESVVEVLSLA